MEKYGKILLVDDNKDVLVALKLLLQEHFKQVDTINTPNTLLSKMRENDYDTLLLDMNFVAGINTGNEGFYWLKVILDADPDAAVIFLTAYADIEKAVKAIQQGAADYIEKPWDDEKLIASVFKAVERRKSRKEIKRLKINQKHLNENIHQKYMMLKGTSPSMEKVYETMDKVAKTDANVLILGENGAGKEIIAREIHRKSLRAEDMFVNVDMASLSETLFESEMFGHLKGAFTDAQQNRTGRFELASGGTLFLDEIGNLPLHMQTKILVVLQNREITPVGASKSIPVNIRLISATNHNLPEMVKDNMFREDLFFRINTITIELPPLRERKEDIPVFANYFIQLYAQKYHQREWSLQPQVMKKLAQYHWPGNIRELQHVIEKAVILGNGKQITENDIFFSSTPKKDVKSLNLADNEKELIRLAINKTKGKYTKAAQELGITRRTLYNKLKQYGL